MKLTIWHLSAVAALLATSATMPAHAQGTSAVANGLSSSQDNTNVAQQVVELQAQLAAVEKETLRRLNCQSAQANGGIVMVSTATGCAEVPGLRDHVAYMVAHPELQY